MHRFAIRLAAIALGLGACTTPEDGGPADPNRSLTASAPQVLQITAGATFQITAAYLQVTRPSDAGEASSLLRMEALLAPAGRVERMLSFAIPLDGPGDILGDSIEVEDFAAPGQVSSSIRLITDQGRLYNSSGTIDWTMSARTLLGTLEVELRSLDGALSETLRGSFVASPGLVCLVDAPAATGASGASASTTTGNGPVADEGPETEFCASVAKLLE